ncbi:hypothetical protein [Sphingomonas sp. LHG3406-1]|uniref:hypothetical protein n=1 Tax=Sphingomonas sp. LHG3406-1 TaxID=2804617 RepID=UPI0026253337|nr:hypothetical protein [Sphingomonas sp. LHG3406-1]
MEIRSFILCAAVALGACSQIPRDPERSFERVRQEGRFRVGVISGSPEGERRGLMLVDEVARTTGARPAIQHGPAEPLLEELEQGRLDLVVGAMAQKSPWRTKVHFLPPLGPDDGSRPATMAMTRNGENAWIAMLYREAGKIGRLQ